MRAIGAALAAGAALILGGALISLATRWMR